MAKRHPKEKILLQWTIDEACWRRFQEASASRLVQRGGSYVAMTAPEPFPASGIEVVVRDDAIFIGKKCACEFIYQGGNNVSMHETWLEVSMSSDSSAYEYLIPVARDLLRDARALAGELTLKDKESMRIQAELDARPTFINGLRRWVEAHPLTTIIGFFVVALPLFVFSIHLISTAFPSWFAK